MPNPLSDSRDALRQQMVELRQDDGVRDDIFAPLFLLMSDNSSPNYAIALFWELYQPDSRLSVQAERVVRDCLDWMYQKYKVPNEPDPDGSATKRFLVTYDAQNHADSSTFPDALKNDLIFIHVAAARAFKLSEANGFSDDTRSCASEVERTFARLRLAGLEPKERINPMEGEGNLEGMGVFLSTLAATAITFVELSRISRVDGRYADSLHYLAQAGELYEYALPTPMGTWWAGPFMAEWYFDKFMKGLRISVEEITNPFALLEADASSVSNWENIVSDCLTLARHSYCWRFHEYEEELLEEWYPEDGIHELLSMHIERVRILYSERHAVTWSAFWLAAHASANAQLSPSQLQESQRRLEQTASEDRLKTYFFGNNWDDLPERARSRLISADNDWNARQRIALEGVLNHILRATTAVCYEFVWYPLEFGEGVNIPRFVDKLEELGKRTHTDPSISDYIWVCEQDFYKEYLMDRELTDDIQFLTEDLPASLHLLRPSRNTAEYEEYKIESPWSRESLRPFFNRFLGIGQPGILPELARIGHKLQSSGK